MAIRSVRVSRYMALSDLLAILVKFNMKRWGTWSHEIDAFHKRVESPDNED